MRPTQLRLFSDDGIRREHGGSVDKGKRKVRRPLDPRRPLHVTLRSSKALGELSLLRCKRTIESLVHAKCRVYGIRLYSFANVGNHLHLCIRFQSRHELQIFMRVVPGLIARMVTGARKGKALSEKFWDERIYTRIVEWGRDYQNVMAYIDLNVLEGLGLIRRCPVNPPSAMDVRWIGLS